MATVSTALPRPVTPCTGSASADVPIVPSPPSRQLTGCRSMNCRAFGISRLRKNVVKYSDGTTRLFCPGIRLRYNMLNGTPCVRPLSFNALLGVICTNAGEGHGSHQHRRSKVATCIEGRGVRTMRGPGEGEGGGVLMTLHACVTRSLTSHTYKASTLLGPTPSQQVVDNVLRKQ